MIYQTNKKKPYWIKYLEKLDNENINFKFIDLIEFDEVKNRFNEIFNKCDGHWNKIGNKIVSEIIFDEKLL